MIVCTPDKDLAQVVSGTRIVQLNRRTREIRDEAGVIAKFGVPPASIPDYLALVGDAADGYPGLPGWGAKSAAAVLAKFGHIESIPADSSRMEASTRQAPARSPRHSPANAITRCCSASLATLRTDVPVFDDVDELRWTGPTPAFPPIAAALDAAVTDEKRRRSPVAR